MGYYYLILRPEGEPKFKNVDIFGAESERLYERRMQVEADSKEGAQELAREREMRIELQNKDHLQQLTDSDEDTEQIQEAIRRLEQDIKIGPYQVVEVEEIKA